MCSNIDCGSARTATAPDGTAIYFETYGDVAHPAIFLGPHFYATRSGEDAALTEAWINTLRKDFFVLVADYPRGLGRTGHPQGLAYGPDIAAQEYECIADAAGVKHFGWVGYSFGGAMGVQVACRTGRVSALAVGGWPPLNAPFQTLLEMARDTASNPPPLPPSTNPGVLASTVAFYTPLPQWPEREEVARLTMPRLAFMGEKDGDVAQGRRREAPLAECMRAAVPDLMAQGWHLCWLDGHDHLSALGAKGLLPRIQKFFQAALFL